MKTDIFFLTHSSYPFLANREPGAVLNCITEAKFSGSEIKTLKRKQKWKNSWEKTFSKPTSNTTDHHRIKSVCPRLKVSRTSEFRSSVRCWPIQHGWLMLRGLHSKTEVTVHLCIQAWQSTVRKYFCCLEQTFHLTVSLYLPPVFCLIEVPPWLFTSKPLWYLSELVQTESKYLPHTCH